MAWAACGGLGFCGRPFFRRSSVLAVVPRLRPIGPFPGGISLTRALTLRLAGAPQSITTLLKQHREAIDELRDVCKDVLEAEHDDIWLLRYVLSRKDKAEAAVRKGIEWRKVERVARFAVRARVRHC